MPVTYRTDKARGTIRTRCAGNVTLAEVIEHFHTLETDPDCSDRLAVLLDLSEVTSIPESNQLRAVSDEICRVRPKVRFDACAIVACSDVLFAMARMFEVFAEGNFRVTSVFRVTSEAEIWLASQQRSAADPQ